MTGSTAAEMETGAEAVSGPPPARERLLKFEVFPHTHTHTHTL